jgi:hypothetical protein
MSPDMERRCSAKSSPPRGREAAIKAAKIIPRKCHVQIIRLYLKNLLNQLVIRTG